MQYVKTKDQIEGMRVAGKLAAEVLEMITPFVVAGTSTSELDDRCYRYITQVQNAIPACLGYHGRGNQGMLGLHFALV